MLCISGIVFLVVLALHVVTTARRAPGCGYLECVLALFFSAFCFPLCRDTLVCVLLAKLLIFLALYK